MTEAEWQTSDDPQKMLDVLREKTSGRKLRLFACACCRWTWPYLENDLAAGDLAAIQNAVLLAEQHAEGHSVAVALGQAGETANKIAFLTGLSGASAAFALTFLDARQAAARTNYCLRWWDEVPAADLVRDIFGNPFRRVTPDPAWLTPTVVSLAQAAYEERILPSGELDAVRLGVLADALEEAGAHGEMLNHLREKGPHVRGCFSIDLLTERG
jgi:hypothetical protein